MSYFRHGHARKGQIDPLHRVWRQIIQRCTNPKDPRFASYGARGITICERWRASFAAFLEDVGPRPPGIGKGGRSLYSLDRIDNDRGYEPGNVRWATASQQQSNTTRSNRITAFGKTQTLAEWGRETDQPAVSIYRRIQGGMPVEEALQKRTQRGPRRVGK